MSLPAASAMHRIEAVALLRRIGRAPSRAIKYLADLLLSPLGDLAAASLIAPVGMFLSWLLTARPSGSFVVAICIAAAGVLLALIRLQQSINELPSDDSSFLIGPELDHDRPKASNRLPNRDAYSAVQPVHRVHHRTTTPVSQPRVASSVSNTISLAEMVEPSLRPRHTQKHTAAAFRGNDHECWHRRCGTDRCISSLHHHS